MHNVRIFFYFHIFIYRNRADFTHSYQYRFAQDLQASYALLALFIAPAVLYDSHLPSSFSLGLVPAIGFVITLSSLLIVNFPAKNRVQHNLENRYRTYMVMDLQFEVFDITRMDHQYIHFVNAVTVQLGICLPLLYILFAISTISQNSFSVI